MTKYVESSLEKAALDWLEELGYGLAFGPDISPEGEKAERNSYDEVVLKDRLKKAIDKLNPKVPAEAKEEAFRKVINIPNLSPDLVTNNQAFHELFTNGVDVEYKSENGEVRGDKVWLIDTKSIDNNDWLAVNQFRIIENKHNRVPDIVVFINGLPVALVELKNPADEKATIKKAFKQTQTYQKEIPSIFSFNEALIVSDGHLAKMGTITSPLEWFMSWKSVDGKVVASRSQNPLKILIKGVFEKERLLDLVTNFIFFNQKQAKNKKIMAAYHQYFATNKALKETDRAAKTKGNKRIGVIWHTQGSGKSYTMAFYAGKVIQVLNNPTIVVLTDRNDLDGQLFDTFVGAKDLLRQTPKQAQGREDLKPN
jgi:type I restriction enzyme R subunit